MNKSARPNLLEPPSRESFAMFCRLIYDRHLVTGVGGNVSARFSDGFLITPGGISLRDVTADSIVFLQNDERVPQGVRPSKEINMHFGIFRERPDVNVIVHAHGSYIIAVSTMVEPGPDSLLPITPGFVYLAYPLPMLPFLVPTTVELAEAVRQQFSDGNLRALLLQNHGLVAIGTNMAEALNIAEEVNEAAMIYTINSGKGSTIPDRLVKRVKS